MTMIYQPILAIDIFLIIIKLISLNIMNTKNSAEKMIKKYLAVIESYILVEYKKIEIRENPKNPEKQIELIKKLLLDYLKMGKNKQNQCQNNPRKQCHLEFIKIQQNYMDQSEKIDRMKKQMQIQFELTKKFINTFKKHNQNQNVYPELQNITMINSITNCRKQKEFRLELSKVRSSDEKCFRKIPQTERALNLKNQNDSGQQEDIVDIKMYPNNQKTKTLSKLKKIQKFFCIKEPSNSISRSSKVWAFSPPKAYYKQQNENLKILQQNLRTQLEVVQSRRKLNINETILNKQENLKKKEEALKQLEHELFKKEINLNKRHAEILRKQQKLKKNID